ncbi:hypothetical protein JCGZ_07033 [Jatropha curcas]|uniref:Glycosyltransferase n=1 Tax=Jatropha curcas TaxID=180498 RepID=A0A067KBF2_JATCU|nr:UDP-glycosyltransferase 73B4 [Jatropha curcas]KDP33462.1 hypothetical protein JCGZ_07033 [Jatropha curcas]
MALSHVVIFPFMAQGHALPLLDLSKALSSQQITVTIITTPGNAKSISDCIHSYPNISFLEIPFPAIDGVPEGCENTSQLPSMEFHLPFLQATKQLQNPFQNILQSMMKSQNPPICVISDFFLGWTLAVCKALGVPRLVFHGMGVLSMAISKSVWVHQPQLKAKSVFDDLDLPGMKLPFTLTSSDLPDTINTQNHDDPLSKFIEEVGEADVNSSGIVCNTFEELERSHIPCFESFYSGSAKAWCVGPLLLYDKMEDLDIHKNNSSVSIMQWLTEQITPNSVIYVSFGTQADLSDAQLDEVAFGLEESGFPFVWAVRSKTWCLPKDIEEKIKGRGLVIKEWVDQRRILLHRAIGGFLSHCGWNSVLESVSAGVPILAWPMIAEQSLNAKLIADGLGAGINVKKEAAGAVVSREAICDGVRELMGGEKGRNARERAEALGREARRAVQEGGSSHRTLQKMIGQLKNPS